MRIIAFADTTQALLARRKTVTRRNWADKTAAGFKKGDVVQAYNRSPRNHGECVGFITIAQDPYKEALAAMPDDDFEAEGFAYLQHNPSRSGHSAPWYGQDMKKYFESWRQSGDALWVVRFELAP